MSIDDETSSVRRPNAARKSWLRRVARMAALIYLGTLAALMFFENSLVYPAPSLDDRTWDQMLDHVDAEQVQVGELKTHSVLGWLYQPNNSSGPANSRRYGLYFHGNGEDLAYSSDFVRRLSDDANMTVLAVEYPGYGRAGGQTSESTITPSAELARAWFCDRFQIDKKQIILIGRSLGGGAVMSLADNSNSQAIILLSTFSSLPDVAADRFWLLPVRMVMRNRFPSAERMKTCTQPLLQFHGDQDQVIPDRFGRRLFDSSSAANKRFVTLAGCGHNYHCGDVVWNAIRDFLNSIEDAEKEPR